MERKRKLIWKDYKYGYYILWIWRFALTWTNEFEYKKYNKTINFCKAKRGFMICVYQYGLGIGHSFGL